MSSTGQKLPEVEYFAGPCARWHTIAHVLCTKLCCPCVSLCVYGIDYDAYTYTIECDEIIDRVHQMRSHSHNGMEVMNSPNQNPACKEFYNEKKHLSPSEHHQCCRERAWNANECHPCRSHSIPAYAKPKSLRPNQLHGQNGRPRLCP